MFGLDVVRCICKQQRMKIEFMANLTALHRVPSAHSRILMWLSFVCINVCKQTQTSNRRHKLLKRFINLFRPLYSRAYPSCSTSGAKPTNKPETETKKKPSFWMRKKQQTFSVCCQDMRERIIKQRKKLIIV